jgi:hypothetical protein
MKSDETTADETTADETNNYVFCHSDLINLLSDVDKHTVVNTIKRDGYDSIDKTRKRLQSDNNNNDLTMIDVDSLIYTDLFIDYKLYITETDIFTRDEIIQKYNLVQYNIEPEDIFNIQKIIVIDNDYYIFDEETELIKNDNQVIYNTKIYIGKEKWKDFIIMFRFSRSMNLIKIINDQKLLKNSEK